MKKQEIIDDMRELSTSLALCEKFINDSTTVRQFVLLTKDSYGSATIRKLPQAYGINES